MMAEERQEQRSSGKPADFVREYGPLAERIGNELGIDPKLILAKFGLETGWGKSVIPGTYNLGNIKDPSGKGVRAYDRRENSNDAYMKFEDPEVFADYYIDFMRRLYPKAIGVGSDVNKFTQGLNQGVAGAYASADTYPLAIRSAYSTIANIPAPGQTNNPFDRIEPPPTELLERVSDVGPAPKRDDQVINPEEATIAGAATGLVAGTVAKNAKLPSSAKYDSALERLNVARDKLLEVQSRVSAGGNLPDLENEFRRAQGMYSQAEAELRAATDELRSLNRAPAAAEAAEAAGEAATRKVPGSSGAANWTRVMADEVPDVVAESATSMRRADPTGGQALIDRDVAARQRLQQMGLGDYELSGRGQTQLALPRDVAAERAAAMEAEVAQRQAQEAAQRQAQTQREAMERARAQARVEQARQARQAAGEGRRAASQAVRQAERGAGEVAKAASGVRVAESALDRAPQSPGGLAKAGEATAKIAPKALGVVSGALTGYTLADAVNEWNKAYNTYKSTGEFPPLGDAVTRTIEAGFGVMSMLPPYSPLTAGLRFIGTVGGLGMAGYEGYKAFGPGSRPPSAEYQAP